jgi:hypothetical protein
MFSHEVIKTYPKRAIPFVGVALIFYLLGIASFGRNNDLKTLVKAQTELLNTIRFNETQYREQQTATIKQLQSDRKYIESQHYAARHRTKGTANTAAVRNYTEQRCANVNHAAKRTILQT